MECNDSKIDNNKDNVYSKKSKFLPLLFMLSIPLSNVFYGLLNNSSRGASDLIIGIDRIVPFLKIFIVPYIIWYPYIALVLIYICLKDKEEYYRTLISMNIGLVFCYIIFYFFQTTVPRPVLTGDDILTKLVYIIYRNDEPYNCFPSVHVLTTYVVMKGANSVLKDKITTTIINIIGSLIILSTQFVKQHVMLDLIAAIVIVEVVYRIVVVIREVGVSECIRKPFLLLTMRKKLDN